MRRIIYVLLLLLLVSQVSYCQNISINEIGAAPFTFPKYEAIIIGTNVYKNMDMLHNPISDAESIEAILKKDYGFQTTILRNPTRSEILANFRIISEKYKKKKDGTEGVYGDDVYLLVYIAGHGAYDPAMGGLIVPTDAGNYAVDLDRDTYIPHSYFLSVLNKIEAKHTLLLLDVCYGGAIDELIAMRGNSSDEIRIDYLEYLKRKKDLQFRKFITSGGATEVPDGAQNDHSPFAKGILTVMESGYDNAKMVTFSDLFSGVQLIRSQPKQGDLGKNDGGSDFVFIPGSLKNSKVSANKNVPPVKKKTAKVTPEKPVVIQSKPNTEVVETRNPKERSPRGIKETKIVFYTNAADPDQDKTLVAMKVKEAFEEKGYAITLSDKAAGHSTGGNGDINMKMDIFKKMENGGDTHSLTIVLHLTDINGNEIYSKSGSSGYFRTTDFEILGKKAINNIIDDILQHLN